MDDHQLYQTRKKRNRNRLLKEENMMDYNSYRRYHYQCRDFVLDYYYYYSVNNQNLIL